VVGTLLALPTIAFARGEPPVTGIWKLSVGKNDAPCAPTLAGDPACDEAGVALPSADCATGLHAISRWRETPMGLELLASGGGIIALLKDMNGSFEG
jgi:hypothetical protein